MERDGSCLDVAVLVYPSTVPMMGGCAMLRYAVLCCSHGHPFPCWTVLGLKMCCMSPRHSKHSKVCCVIYEGVSEC